MKKVIFAIVATAILVCCFGLASVSAESDSVDVFITVADGEGDLALSAEKVSVTDNDGDGVISINDALFAAHEGFYEGGAAAGYEAVESAYGLSLNKLWGVENGGSYGYFLNNASAWSLVDPVSQGDYLAAYAYTDLTAWSDTYCYFDKLFTEVEEGEGLPLTLSAAGFDDAFNPVVLAVQDAVITINGEKTEITTDSEGKVSLTFTESGEYLVGAVSDSMTLVTPVCKVTVIEKVPASEDTNEVPETGDSVALLLCVTAALIAFGVVISLNRKKLYEY